jgi:hypothetical protein
MGSADRWGYELAPQQVDRIPRRGEEEEGGDDPVALSAFVVEERLVLCSKPQTLRLWESPEDGFDSCGLYSPDGDQFLVAHRAGEVLRYQVGRSASGAPKLFA